MNGSRDTPIVIAALDMNLYSIYYSIVYLSITIYYIAFDCYRTL